MARYLPGENICPRTTKQARALIGKRVRWISHGDIDKSGRGYFFPRGPGVVTGAIGRNIEIDGDFMSLPALVEMVEAD